MTTPYEGNHMKARSPTIHDDQNKEYHHERENLDQSCGQRNCVSAFHLDSSVPLHDELVITVREEPDLHFFYQLHVTD